MNLQRSTGGDLDVKQAAGDTTGVEPNLLVVLGVCVKLLFGDKVVLDTVLLVRLLGSGCICNITLE